MNQRKLETTDYVPILRLKQGELNALQKISDEVREHITPFFELSDVDKDWSSGVPIPKKDMTTHINDKLLQIEKTWGNEDYFYFQIPSYYFQDGGVTAELFSEIDSALLQKLQYIPAVSLSDNEDYWMAMKPIVDQAQSRLAIRVQLDMSDEESAEPSKEDYDRILAYFDANPENVDLVIDLGSIEDGQAYSSYLAMRLLIAVTPYIEKWNNIIIAASSFPESLGSVTKGSSETRERTEWLAWKKLQGTKRVKRFPVYGDYSISNPMASEDIDPRYMKPSASIRYSLREEWLIVRGKSLRTYKFDQFHSLSQVLSTSTYFFGADYSAGDEFIHICATDENSGTGNLTTWREVGNNHHFTLVVEQLASWND